MATWVSRVKNNVTLMLPDSTVGDAGTNLSDDLEALQDGLGELDADNITSGTLLPAYGGTGANTEFTAGSIVFAASAGVYAEDNANLFYDATNARLGIGIATPAYPLDVNGDINASGNVNAAAFVVGGNTIIGAGGNIYSAGGYQLVDPSGNIYTPVAGMVIDSSGNLTNIGSINATAAGGSLSVQSTTLYYGSVFTIDASSGRIQCGGIDTTGSCNLGLNDNGLVYTDASGNLQGSNNLTTDGTNVYVPGYGLDPVIDSSGNFEGARFLGATFQQSTQLGSSGYFSVDSASNVTGVSFNIYGYTPAVIDGSTNITCAGLTSNGNVGFFGATPVGQPASPTTLADVIAALKALGLVAT